MKKIFPILIFLLLVFLMSGCSSMAATPVYVPEGAERDAIVANTDTILQSTITGIENKDSTTFSKYFSKEMQAAMTPAAEEKLFNQFETLGKAQSTELINVQEITDNYAVRYKVTYEKKVVIFRIVVSKADTLVETGLWFE